MIRFPLPAGALRVAMVVVLIGATPLATGAAGYYIGRSQVRPVAEPTSFNLGAFYLDGQQGRWMTVVFCPVDAAAIAAAVTSSQGVTAPVLVPATAANPPRCPSAP
jgi:hypothetical protein